MIQNLKVDIIYHRSASDFEMEFNLCGCCRMRLLNDKTEDKKGFIKALARDVSRSRIIIACGPLFGAEGLIRIVAAAIGGSITVCNNKTYGINGDEKIKIISGSTPLVTPDGYFGGCIIESGPQTIILLTENKAFRKAIMQNLIHPYIEEISYIPTKNSPIIKAEPMVEAVEEVEFLTTPDKAYQEDAVENIVNPPNVPQNEHNIEFIMDNEEDEEPQEIPAIPMEEDTYKMYTVSETPHKNNLPYENSYEISEEDDMFLAAEEYNEEENIYKNKSKLRSLNITIVILVLLLMLAILALVYFIVLKPTAMGMSTTEYLKQIFGTVSETVQYL